MVRRPRVAVLSTGDELVPPGTAPLPAGAIHDSNGAILAAAVAENGGEPMPIGIVPDDEAALEAAVRQALAICRHRGAVAAAPRRAPATWRTASSRGSARPASWCTAWR